MCFLLVCMIDHADSGFLPPVTRSNINTKKSTIMLDSPHVAENNVQELRAIDIPIVFENNFVLIMNKPAGICHHESELGNGENVDDGQQDKRTHGDDKTDLGILSLVRGMQDRGQISYQGRIYGVHRLDRVTSGILIFAKDANTAGLIGKAFRERKITKYYVALSSKRPKKKKQGMVKGDMIRTRRGAWQLTRSLSDPAETRFFTSGLGNIRPLNMENAPSIHQVVPRTLMLFKPVSGKTHQIRVASKSVGLPILGDHYYGGGSDVERTYLHASAIHIQLDDIGIIGGGEVTVLCVPPFKELFGDSEEFLNAFKAIMRKHCDCEPILTKLDTL